jgi:hypothetical protein
MAKMTPIAINAYSIQRRIGENSSIGEFRENIER